MANTFFGIDFPFSDSTDGRYLKMTNKGKDEVRASLIHLLLTRKGSRYYLPDFGTRLYDYLFEPMTDETLTKIKQEVTLAVERYLPEVRVNNIDVTPYLDSEESPGEYITGLDERLYRIASKGTEEYTAKLKIEYSNKVNNFGEREFVIINV